MPQQCPQWIDEYAKATHNAFCNMVPGSWGPLDLFAILGLLEGTFIAKVYEAVKNIKKRHLSIEEAARTLSSPSALRAALLCLFVEYQRSTKKNKVQFRETAEYLIEALSFLMKEDRFASKRNIIHTKGDIEKLLHDVNWQPGNPAIAKALGKLHTSKRGYIYALYRDFFNDDGAEVYGPHDVSYAFGKNTILTMKHFSRIKPVELWPQTSQFKYSDARMYHVHKNVAFTCELWGVHCIYKGDLINNLVSYAVTADGVPFNSQKDIAQLTSHFAEAAIKQSFAYDSLSKEDLKKKNLEWLCHRFIDFFKLAGMDWRPTQAMLDAVRGKDVPDRLEMNTFPSFEEYATNPDYEIYWLKDLYK